MNWVVVPSMKQDTCPLVREDSVKEMKRRS